MASVVIVQLLAADAVLWQEDKYVTKQLQT